MRICCGLDVYLLIRHDKGDAPFGPDVVLVVAVVVVVIVVEATTVVAVVVFLCTRSSRGSRSKVVAMIKVS